ncbi:MAG: divergent polysaccharide deacetylase family protein [Arcobacteraceae bacterium]|nr:divergent polysaccharide deacetylase family protein [Arcobacteraceae bacterium]
MPKKKQNRKKRKHSSNKSYIHYINILIISISIILLAFLTNQFILSDNSSETMEITKQNQPAKNTKTVHEKFEEQTKALEIEYVDNEVEDDIQILTKPNHTFNFNEPERIENKLQRITLEKEIQLEITPKIEKKIISEKIDIIKEDDRPTLAILIDDVTTSYQVRNIENIGYPITMAFLPPTDRHRNSAKIAKQFDRYMIHLPLEAGTRRYEEKNTLYITDSLETIDKRIKYLKSIYPKAKYINNHTGSKFTSDRRSMDRLMQVLKKYDFIFVDSRTTAKTKAKIYAKKHNVKYLSRNIFLDNKQDRYYIQNQLKKAIRIARKTGVAIAIGHPHSITLKTLKNSKHLLTGINLVYITSL